MRTILILVFGLLLMASLLIVAKLFSANFPSVLNWALAIGLGVWLAITGTNMWIGVSRAGYSVIGEMPIPLLLFLALAAAGCLATLAVSISYRAYRRSIDTRAA